ncbi:MAG: zinc-dependent metalloprotease [Cytophagales bacterium]|nr:zinc-dependent metalloprotease [Cytophagales bacterium]
MRKTFTLLLLVASCLTAYGQPKKSAPSPAAKPAGDAPGIGALTAGLRKSDGFLPFYWDEKKGRLYLEIPKFDTELLYYPSLAAGVGSNDIGLDRGRLGQEHVVKFVRSGPKVLLVEPNLAYRAVSTDEAERRAVEESFAQSVHWGFKVAAEEGGRVLVDATDFFMQDAVGAAADISRTRQGTFKLDPDRCAFYLPRTKNFPENTEVEVTITLTGDGAGPYLREVTPTARAVTMRQHHSFVQLPDNNYQPRAYDPRSGLIGGQYFDYATPVQESVIKRFVVRHRLQKKDPSAAVSEAVEPIVYYMDPGAPEPIRSALMDGAAWWNQAFEAAGYKNAFQVKLLPPDADPMDARYNVIQWVHRSTRGWSYGASVTDPRTGEIIKGKVTLGSLRVRQDYLIAQGLVAAYEEGKPVSDEMMQMSLARLRQLAAHEVGHTLGLPHNYVASTHNLASVMDYPHPVVQIKDGRLDLSNAYGVGIGEWDKVAITYAYQDFPKGTDEKAALNKMITDYLGRGLQFLTDQDARPEGSSHSRTHLWDNGANAVDELNRVMDVRRIALQNFSEKKIPVGTPLATLEEVLVPLYLFHRYQLEAAAKVVGGVDYTFAVRGDGQKPVTLVDPAEQRRALDALLATVRPEVLALPEKVLGLIPPRPYGFDENPRETFKDRTGLTFDALGPAEAAASLTFRFLLHSERAARLVNHHALNAQMPALEEVVDKLLNATWKNGNRAGYAGEIARLTDRLTLQHLAALAAGKENAGQVRAVATAKIGELKGWLTDQAKKEPDAAQRAHFVFALGQIKEFETNPAGLDVTAPLPIPAGAPIGSPDYDWLDCEFGK